MTARQPCPPAPGPLEEFAAPFDPLFGSLGQRRGFRGYLSGLLAPRDRNKTLTALAGAEPLVQAQSPEVQRLQYFLAEAGWSAEALNARRLELLQGEAATAAHRGGVLVLDDTGDRKDGTATAHVGRQYLGSVGKTDNGIVAVTTLWTDGRVHYPLHFAPYTPASRFPGGKSDPRFRTKPQIALAVIEQARAADIPFHAVVADCFYGDNAELEGLLTQRKIPYVLAHRGTGGRGWAPAEDAHCFAEAVGDLPRAAWRRIRRRFRDGHGESWWAAGGAGVPALRPAQGASRPLRHHRPASPPVADDVVSVLEPQGRLARGDRPALCVAQPDRGRLQAREGRARVGGLPGPRRHRHPPALGAGLRGVQLLLVAGRARGTVGRAAPRRRGIEACESRPCRTGGKMAARSNPPPGRRRCGRCEPGWHLSAG
jgi:DDE superfamily endonuclease